MVHQLSKSCQLVVSNVEETGRGHLFISFSFTFNKLHLGDFGPALPTSVAYGIDLFVRSRLSYCHFEEGLVANSENQSNHQELGHIEKDLPYTPTCHLTGLPVPQTYSDIATILTVYFANRNFSFEIA